MALLWLESFGSFGTTNGNAPAPTNVVSRKYSAIAGESGMDVEAGLLEGRSMECGSAGDRVIVTPTLTTCTTLIAGGWFYLTNEMGTQSGGSLQSLINFNETTNRSLCLLQGGSGLFLARGGATSAPILGWTTRFKIPPVEWVFIELKAFCNNTTGWAQVRVNGQTVLTVNNVDTQNSTQGYYDRVRWSSFEQFAKWGDLYIADTTGNTNNDYLGPIHINTIRPDGDLSNSLTTGGYADMDEAQCDDATSYAEAGGSGEEIEMTYVATNNFAAIKGVMVCTTLSVDANTVFQHTSNNGSTRVDSANWSVNSTNINSYTTMCSLFETDPTGNAWTPGTVNSNAFGIEHV